MPHISFSALKTWKDCPYKFKLVYKDKISAFHANEFTLFGNAVHEYCETMHTKQYASEQEQHEEFDNIFTKWLTNHCQEKYGDPNFEEHMNAEMISEMFNQGKNIVVIVLPSLQEYFGDFVVLGIEENLYEKIDEFKSYDYDFKGFVDLIIQTSDGKIHIIDFKTTSWGWDAKKKSDPLVTYQLTLYKNYLCKKHDWEPKKVETYFVLLKRTATKDQAEVLRITSGNKKTQNALKMLHEVVYNVGKKTPLWFKNRKSCKYCPFYNTEHCT